MSLEKLPEPIITDDEARFITKSRQSIYVSGMLAGIRSTGRTLKEVYDEAISQPGSEEHIAEVTQARNFLVKNSDRFGLPLKQMQ